MFCNNCGKSIPEGSKFCLECGNQLKAETAPAAQNQGDEKKGFFSSPAAIALVVIIGVAVLAGISLGIFFLVKGDPNSKADAATMDVWEAYQETLEDNGSTVAKIDMNNTNYLFQAQADLNNAKERVAQLQETLARTGGTRARTVNNAQLSKRDMLANALEDALKGYEAYISKTTEFVDKLIWAVANNQLINPEVVNSLNGLLADMQNLAKAVQATAKDFIDGNELLTNTRFDPSVLTFANDIAPKIEAKVAELQASEAARLEAERQAAEAQAAELERQKKQQEQQAQTFMCPNCNGTGMTPGGTCGVCNGSGRVTYQTLIDKGWYESDDGWMPPDTDW